MPTGRALRRAETGGSVSLRSLNVSRPCTSFRRKDRLSIYLGVSYFPSESETHDGQCQCKTIVSQKQGRRSNCQEFILFPRCNQSNLVRSNSVLRCRHAFRVAGLSRFDFIKTHELFDMRRGSRRIKSDHFAFLQTIENFDHIGRILADFDHAAFETFIMCDVTDLLSTIGSDRLMWDRQYVFAS